MPSTSIEPIHVAPSRRYFETASGEPFLFIGMNDAISWPGLAGLYRRRDVPAAEAYLRAIADSGITIVRLMLEYAQRDRYFEKPVGRFNPALVRFWDDLIERCEALGLRILLTPFDNFWMFRRWKHHPYNRINGGPAAACGDFLCNEAVIQAMINRLRFVVERWGYSGAIAAWDLFNEIHPFWGGTTEQQCTTLSRLSHAIRETEMRLWGFTRPQGVSHFGPRPDGDEYNQLIFQHPDLDFATTHIYYKGSIDYPPNTVLPALAMAEWVRYGVAHAKGRPFTDSEHSPIHLFNDLHKTLPEDFDDEYERHLMWAHLAAGGAGSGMRWPARHPHLLTPGMRRALGSLKAFTRCIDWHSFEPACTAETVTLCDNRFHAVGCADGKQAVAWLVRAVPDGYQGMLPTHADGEAISLQLAGMEAGAYHLTFWDTLHGCARSEQCIRHDGSGPLDIVTPPVEQDMALAVRRVTG